MSEKRFECIRGSRTIIDNETKLHHIMSLDWECILITKQLNNFAEENEQLKLLSNYRGEMVSFATSLIQDMGSEEMLKIWNDFTEVMYQKWKKKRGIK